MRGLKVPELFKSTGLGLGVVVGLGLLLGLVSGLGVRVRLMGIT